jgi:hypothetical protein
LWHEHPSTTSAIEGLLAGQKQQVRLWTGHRREQAPVARPIVTAVLGLTNGATASELWRSSSIVSVELCGILSAPGGGHQIEVLEHREDRLAYSGSRSC